MRFFSSPLFLLLALGLVYGTGRFGFAVGQSAFGRAEELRAQKARQEHVTASVRAVLLEGHEPEAEALLARALGAGAIESYALRREEKVIATTGALVPRKLTSYVTTTGDAGPYSWEVGDHWSWPERLARIAFGVAQEVVFLLLAGAVLFFAGRRWRRRHARPRRTDSVRILREIHPEKPPRSKQEPKPAPVEGEAFECTLLRVVAEPADEPARARVLDVAVRYGGELVSVSGGEFTCCFRDEGDGHSALTALAAARDLRELFRSGRSQYALAHGFARFVGGAERKLAGAPFLELAKLSAGDGQVIVTERVAKFAAPAVKFKAKDGRITYAGHPDAGEALARALRNHTFSELDAFHADDHLEAALRELPSADTEACVGLAQRLRRFSYHGCGAGVREAFRHVLREELRRQDTYRLSSLIALAPKIYSRSTVDEEARGLFLDALALGDRRVKSNTIQLFIDLYPNEEIAELKPYAKSADHRISANVLIKQALEHFDERVVRQLYGRVRGGSVAHVASALFAIGEIAQHYRQHGPAGLRGKTSFLRLFEEIPYWVKHPNTMVRRQSLAAARKLGDAELDQKLRAIFDATDDPELLALFASIYDWRKDEKGAGARRTG